MLPRPLYSRLGREILLPISLPSTSSAFRTQHLRSHKFLTTPLVVMEPVDYVAAKATYIRLLLAKGGFFGPTEFACFFCLFVRHATMLRTESLDGSYTH